MPSPCNRCQLRAAFFPFKLLISMSLLLAGQAAAQPAALTEAELYRIQNQVQLLPYQQAPRHAAIADPLLPRDGVQTRSQSRAEVLFNEGSLARIGANSIFRFVPGLRNYQLPGGGTRAESVLQLEQGIALVMGAPGSTANQVQTPEAQIEMAGIDLPDGSPAPQTTSAVLIAHSPTLANTQVFNLAPTPVTIANLAGTETATLQAGQTLTVTEGELGAVETFDLNVFFASSGLAIGLGPNQEDQLTSESAEVQEILAQIRSATVAAANAQGNQLAGFCSADQAAILQDDCITTDNDPLSTFEEDRELITPSGEEPPPPEPPPVDPPPVDPPPVDPPPVDPPPVDPPPVDPPPVDPPPVDPPPVDPPPVDPPGPIPQ
jgi:hypothetical protein